jgi:hypothetical protein
MDGTVVGSNGDPGGDFNGWMAFAGAHVENIWSQ